MKTAFKIETVSNLEYPQDLLIEVGWEGISLVYYTRNPFRIEGLYIYSFDKNITLTQMTDELAGFFAGQDLPAYNNCTICYNYKEVTLVPAAFYKEEMTSAILDTLFQNNSLVNDYAEKITTPDAYILYRVDGEVGKILNEQFPSAKKQHSNSLQVQHITPGNDFLYCIIYQKSIKVFLYKNGGLQITQYFEYTTPADVAYHLLNLSEQHLISPSDMTVILSGFIDTKSNLYDELYRYFLHIQVDDSARDVELATGIDQYPLHFFSHLISLVKCVS